MAHGPTGASGQTAPTTATAEMAAARVCAHVYVNTIQMPRAPEIPLRRRGAIRILVQVSVLNDIACLYKEYIRIKTYACYISSMSLCLPYLGGVLDDDKNVKISNI